MALELALLFGGLFLVLIVASVVTDYIAPRIDAETLANLRDRLRAWWAMIGILAVAFLLGRAGLIILFAFCSFAVLREFFTLVDRTRADHYALFGSFALALPIQYAAIWIEWYGFYSIYIPVYAFLLAPVLSVLRGQTEGFLARVSQVQWGLMIAVFCISHVPALLSLDIPGFEGRQILLVAFLLLVVQSSDVLQYVWGKTLGRTKLAPQVSPSKTWEGLIGGVLSASVIGALLHGLTPFGPVAAFGMAFLAAIMGAFGGLVLSAIKRDRGVKDWGHGIAGHGGFLDRLDGVAFAAPVFFHLTRYAWTP
ncbi:phosphatidate cytidylyltransferase [Jannaschia aquimarina]|uniref:CdsA_1 protein n=1 Tax=Jannaschia aquimarina TaxID=935700 RepID=A0A0D1ELI2_9RHOB|nr:phosphatidate cytidylyltransferase [Jannaschia aquimarina]KIT16635.1 Phosphatidate cytidylyltransferase [Jannaschia aquimarina]SNS93734.1 phosphatidate cytidylyltransferase [Jannaschia aquimarina]